MPKEIQEQFLSNFAERSIIQRKNGVCVWFTGLSGSGKTTLSGALEIELCKKKIQTFILDGDIIRKGLNKDLGFSDEDRTENIRRIGEVSKLFVQAGIVIITAFISPFNKDRLCARNLFDEGKFIEVFVECEIAECERRDPKGLYKKARAGEIKDFTGVSSPYEVPENPEVIIHNGKGSDVNQNVKMLLKYLEDNKIV